jgi:glycosyltransferase involved in cell wall biosynthesis
MNSTENLVSIIIPTLNRVELLKKSIKSVIEQTYENWELLIVDNSSSDATDLMIRKYYSEDKRIKLLKVPTSPFKGISPYLNIGIEHARGKYISRLDDDDIWCNKNVLKIQAEFLDNNPEYVLVGGGVIIINENYEEVYKYFKRESDEDIRKNALISNPFSHNTVMFRKNAFLQVGGYENHKFAEDWDLWLKMGKIGKFYNFQQYFTYYLSTGQNTSFNKLKEQSKYIFKIIKKHKDVYPNFWKGYIVHIFQYTYSLLPLIVRKKMHNYLIYSKRNNL